MGHSDPKITLKHYGHWVPERQERLTDILKSAWKTEDARQTRGQKGWRKMMCTLLMTTRPTLILLAD